MALHNLARVTVTVGGTGSITLGAAVPTFNDLVTAGVGNGETVTYAIEDLSNSSREIGRGSYNTSTKVFTRSTVLASTNSGNPINVTTAGQLFVTVAAEDIAPLPDLVGTNGQLIVGQTGAQSAWKTVNGDLTLSAAGLATIVNITTGATMAGDLVATNIVAPATPSLGSTALYVDSTNKVLSSKNDAGTVSNTVVPSTAAAHQFATAVSASGVVTYTQPAATDISSGAALTTANDTNVTLTAGGSAASALLAASSITAGWTGTLAAGRLNANVVQIVFNDTNVTGSIATQSLTLGWTGTLAVPRGGTGAGSWTSGGVLYGNNTSALNITAAPTSGQILVGNTTTPGWATMSGDATITNLGGLTIAANAVTNAKMATVTNQTIKSNISGATATPSDNTLTAILDNILGSSQGDIIYRGASSWTVLAPGTAGNILQTGGPSANPSWVAGASGTIIKTVTKQTFTSSGTYTPTTGMVFCIIECVGSGGGGGGAALGASLAGGGAGGGSGGYSRTVATAATVGASQTVTIGSAGGAGANTGGSGGNGNDVSVGVICVGKGGSGGAGLSAAGFAAGGAGGVAGTGDVTAVGMPGGSAFSTGSQYTSGFGGSSYFGGGARGAGATSAGAAGINAGNYGSGGSGGGSFNGGGGNIGGTGSTGIVVITEFLDV